MQNIISYFLAIPLIGFLISLVLPSKSETTLSVWAFTTVGIQLLFATCFLGIWLLGGAETLQTKGLILYQNTEYIFQIDFLFDRITAVYLMVGSILTFLVTLYSRYYLHRENGYKRFFNTTLFFFFGYCMIVMSGNLETLFIGWEVLGISSFLLISFYRERYLPVKNAVKVFSIYRIADVGIILAMWASHHLWHQNITFFQLNNAELVHEHLSGHSAIGVFISCMFLLSAMAKSAQLPFSSWLPRAMEGPTPSSAIFYGSLSVHIGVFLLIRTFPFWEFQSSVRIAIAMVGLFTAIIGTGIARVQSSVKSQIAYSSLAQIGLIFIEMALGLENLALFHFAGNAFLRTYQLLVSPSVVSYLIREKFYDFQPRKTTIEDSFPKKLQNTLYVLCLKEWNLDSNMYQYLWNPLKKIGSRFNLFRGLPMVINFIITYGIGLFFLIFKSSFPESFTQYLPEIFGLIAVILVLKSFTERKSVRMSWWLVIVNHFWVALALTINGNYDFQETELYLAGIIVAAIIGALTLQRLFNQEGKIYLNRFQGLIQTHPKIGFLFFLCCLGVTGFPITTTFIGEDLVFTHIREDQYILAFLISLSFILDGLATIRIYARVFMGPHYKTHSEFSNRYF